MASYTTNLNLKKPAGSENVAIGDINNNMDTIDNAYGTLNSKTTVTANPVNGTLSNDSVLARNVKNVIIAGTFTATANISGYTAILNNIPQITGVIPFFGMKSGGVLVEMYASGTSIYTRSSLNNEEFIRFSIKYITD